MKALVKRRYFEDFKPLEEVQGENILSLVRKSGFPPELFRYLQVTINGTFIPVKYWNYTTPNHGATVRIVLVPAGGGFGEFLKVAAVVAITITVSAYAGPAFGPWVAAALTAGASIGSSLILNSIFPPPGAGGLPGLSYDSNSRKSINVVTSQSNRADPYGPCIKPYGKNRVYPRVASAPFSFFNANDSFLVTVYDFGIGDYLINEETLKIGETSISEFEGVSYNIVRNFNDDDFLYYVNDVFSDGLGITYDSDNDSAVRTTQVNTDFFQIDIVFPSGLAGIDGAGNFVTNKVYFKIEYRENGSSEWKSYQDTDFDVDGRFSPGFTTDETKYLAEIFPESDVLLDNGLTYKILEQYGPYTTGIYGESVLEYYNGRVQVRLKTSKVNILLNPGDQIIFRQEVFTIVSNDGTYSYIDRPIDVNEVTDWTFISGYSENPLAYGYYTKIRRFFDDINIVGNSTDRLFSTITVYPKEGPKTWDVRLTRTATEKSGREPNNFNEFQWSQLKSYKKVKPLETSVPHTFLELKIKASDQLNGRVENLSAEITSIVDVYDPITETWAPAATKNPAWIFADILTGPVNQRAVPKSRLDIDSLVNWANYCDENSISYKGKDFGFEANFVIDSKLNVRDLIRDLCSSARGTLSYKNGKYGVVVDEERTTPVQIFTPRNYSNFKSARRYVDAPHGIKCKFVDPNSGWQINEVIAYADGYDENNASLFEEMDMFGVTNEAQAWRQGRYFMAIAKLRQEDISIRVSIDHLSCTRGDLVRLVSDVMKVGGTPSRIKSVNANTLKLDDVIFDNGEPAEIQIRHLNGEIETHEVLELVSTTEVRIADASKCSPGDLAVFGESEKSAIDCIVKSIIPDSDLNATIILAEYAPGIFDADTGTIPDYSPVIIDPDQTTGAKPNPVTNLESSYSITCDITEKRYRYTINLSWDPPIGSLVENYEVYSTVGGQTILAGIVKANSFIFNVENRNIDKEHSFKVLAVSGTGAKLSLKEAAGVSFTPYQDITPPGQVQNFNANILSERIELEWILLSDCDIEKYVIKYYPDTSGARWSTAQTISEVGSGTNSKSVPLKTGTYLIKAVDWAGNFSEDDKRVITTIPENQALKLVKEISGPNWVGSREGVRFLNGDSSKGIILNGSDDYGSFNQNVGYFYLGEIVDLGDVYKARFESQIVAGGFSKSSLMKNWETLADVEVLAGGYYEGKVKAEVEIRVKAKGDVMADWVALSDVKFLAFGTENNTGPWKKLTVGDFTGRRFQVRIKLTTDDLSMTPIVYSAKIKATFPSRDTEGENAVSGTPVVFSPGFVEPPKLQITAQENIEQGDFHEIIEKTGEGFTVQFYDKNENPVNDRTFDWKATGFGVKYFDGDLIYQ